MTSELKALRDIINSSVDSILAYCEKTGKEFPSLNDPVDPSEWEAEGIRNHRPVAENITLTVSAAFQLIQTIQNPAVTAATNGFQGSLPAALQVAENRHIPEILRVAGPQGLHVKDIANKTNLEPIKLSVVLRLLAIHHYFKEIAPDVFTNNRLSSVIDSGKDPAELAATNWSPAKYRGSGGVGAWIAFSTDECLKGCGYLRESLTDPATAFSHDINKAAFQKSHNTPLGLFEYYDQQPDRMERFGLAMAACNKVHPPRAAEEAFDWDTLPKGSLVVDVASGVGHVTMPVAKKYPDLEFMMEDREGVVANAKEYWRTNCPDRVDAGTVNFNVMDLFSPQPSLPKPPGVFFMRMILHDWGPEQTIAILKHLRNAAGPDTRLVSVDSIVEHAIQSKDNSNPAAPAPLLGSLGYANLWTYTQDLNIRAMINSGERTVETWEEVFKASGWKIESIRKLGGNTSWSCSIVCAPI